MTNKTMTNKEIAERLQKCLHQPGKDAIDEVRQFINELDPPKPEPGTLLWWREKESDEWWPGIVDQDGAGVEDSRSFASWKDIEWKPAQVLGPHQVVADKPHPSAFGPGEKTALRWVFYDKHGEICGQMYAGVDDITRAEAEEMYRD